MPTKRFTEVPDALSEEYYQVTLDILSSFSKYRPPLNIFRFKEDIARIEPFYRVGERLSNEKVEELRDLAREGFIFFSRTDHPIYAKHISHQLDLVLADKNLKENEIADIFVEALTMRLENFFEQPVQAVCERLREDVLVLTEYVWGDVFRLRALVRRMHKEHSLARHSFNCGVLGMALFTAMYSKEFQARAIKRKTFDNVALAFFLHDMGMSKVPPFIRDKAQPLTREEQARVLQHPLVGYEMLTKFDLRFPEFERCVLEHHERLDGSGYPRKLQGADMSTLGKLCAVVDSYCAMTVKRPYADAIPPAKAAHQLFSDTKRYEKRMTTVLQTYVMTIK